MTDPDYHIRPVEVYRGVGIHNGQSADRIERVVKPEIDHVFSLREIDSLVAYCGDPTRAPESWILAAAMVEGMFGVAIDERRARPDVDLEFVRACVAGLDLRRWRSPWVFGSLLDTAAMVPGQPGSVPRPAEFCEVVERDRADLEAGK